MGKNWAIAVGINVYDNLLPLKYAKADAEAMASWFKDEANFDEIFLFTEDSPKIPQNNPSISTKPTYGTLRRFLRAQFENIEKPLLKPEDNLWFFFAGHGRRAGDKDYLMLSDSDPGDVEHTAISVEYVTQRLRRSGAENVVLLLDACREKGSRGGLGIGFEKHQGVITFYSCTANELSWEIEELKHGSFTHTLLEGLRLQAEANCATVERLNRYLCHQVPELNKRYGRKVQNPYLKAEPPYKMYFILLEHSATLKDVEPLKFQASLAENKGNLPLAEQLWIRVLTVSPGDNEAIAAIQRIAVKKITERQDFTQEPVISIPESATLPRGEEREASETEIQKEEQHQQNLERYRQSFSQAVELEFPLNEPNLRKLRSLKQSLQLTDEEGKQIEQPIVEQKEEERLEQQQEVERELRQREEAERLQQQQEAKKNQEASNFVFESLVIPSLQAFEFEVVKLVVKVEKSGFLGLGSKVKINTHRSPGQAEYFTEDLGNGITLDMVSIPGGSFMMGSPEGEGRDVEKPQHKVTVKPFFMGKYQVTQKQWRVIASFPKVSGDLNPNPSYFLGDDLPVENVNWEEAVEFCARLSLQTRRKYRLPTEAEWEYACRSSTTTPFYFGETITGDLANYRASQIYANEPEGEYRGETTPVGSFPPNAFGLYDMHGNVAEWCEDDWHNNYEDAPNDGTAWLSGVSSAKVVRGGSWCVYPTLCRSAYRNYSPRANRDFYIGFRVVCVAGSTT